MMLNLAWQEIFEIALEKVPGDAVDKGLKGEAPVFRQPTTSCTQLQQDILTSVLRGSGQGLVCLSAPTGAEEPVDDPTIRGEVATEDFTELPPFRPSPPS